MRTALMGFGFEGTSDYLWHPGCGTFVDTDPPEMGGGGKVPKRHESTLQFVEKPIRVQFGSNEHKLDEGGFTEKFGVRASAVLRYHRNPQDRGTDGGVSRAIINQRLGHDIDRAHIAAVGAQAETIEANMALRHHLRSLQSEKILEILFTSARIHTEFSRSYFFDALIQVFGSSNLVLTGKAAAYFDGHAKSNSDGISHIAGADVTRFMVEGVLPLAVERSTDYTDETLNHYLNRTLPSPDQGLAIERESARNPYLMARIVALKTRAVQSLSAVGVADFQVPDRLVYVKENEDADRTQNVAMTSFVDKLTSTQALDILLSGKTTLSSSIFVQLVEKVLGAYLNEQGQQNSRVMLHFRQNCRKEGKIELIDADKVAQFMRGEFHTFAQTRPFAPHDVALNAYLDGRLEERGRTAFERNMTSDGLLDLRVRVMREQRESPVTGTETATKKGRKK